MTRRYKKMQRFAGFLACFAAKPMDADELDGFLVGLNCRPERSIPSEWKLLLFNSQDASIREPADLHRFTEESAFHFEETSAALGAGTYKPEFMDGEEDGPARFRRFGRWVDGFGRGLLFHAGKRADEATQLLTPLISVLSMGRVHGYELADGGAHSAAAMVESIAGEVRLHVDEDAEAARQFEEDGKNVAANLQAFYEKLPEFVNGIAGR